MPRPKAAPNAKTKTPKVRTTTADGDALLNNPYITRGAVAIFLLLMLLLFTRSEVVDYIFGGGSGRDLHGGISDGGGPLSSIFTPEVQFWREDILRWSGEWNLNPNIVATIVQIESCGNPHAESPGVGAQGLFQVMPLHFEAGQNQFDREQNAAAGLNHLQDCLGWANWDLGVAFACYNAGPSVTGLAQSQWPQEAQYYYTWGSGIYSDATSGTGESPTLERWLSAGGGGLCQQASQVQQIFRLK